MYPAYIDTHWLTAATTHRVVIDRFATVRFELLCEHALKHAYSSSSCAQVKQCHLLPADAFLHIPTSMSAGRALTLKPQGRSTQQELIIADSEEPLVLHRQHGPAKRAFLDAHALPCSSPNSPPDPLCSYVPATADGASPMKGAQKKAGSPKAKPGKVGEVAAGGPGHVPNLADAEATAGGAAGHGKQGKHAAR